MNQNIAPSKFKAKVLRPADLGGDALWGFVVLPQGVSDTLPRRGRTTVEGTLNGHGFRATLEPDGRLSHWLRIDAQLLETCGISLGDTAAFTIAPADQEPEPVLPVDFKKALAKTPEGRAVWDATTTLARLDWIHWMTSAKQAKTRSKRIADACDMLASGKKRVCCFDPSGHYSKAFSPPKAAD